MSETSTQDQVAGSAGVELQRKGTNDIHFQSASFQGKSKGNAAYAILTGGRPLARDAPRGARRRRGGLNKRTAGP